MNEKVRVTVNGKETSFFLGLSVRHAIGIRALRAVREGRAEVSDGDGNQVGLEGALYNGQTLVVRFLGTADGAAPSSYVRKRPAARG